MRRVRVPARPDKVLPQEVALLERVGLTREVALKVRRARLAQVVGGAAGEVSVVQFAVGELVLDRERLAGLTSTAK